MTSQQMLQAMFSTPPDAVIEEWEYRCSVHGHDICYPEVLHNDNRCSECDVAAPV